jgi:hypothetical protein
MVLKWREMERNNEEPVQFDVVCWMVIDDRLKRACKRGLNVIGKCFFTTYIEVTLVRRSEERCTIMTIATHQQCRSGVRITLIHGYWLFACDFTIFSHLYPSTHIPPTSHHITPSSHTILTFRLPIYSRETLFTLPLFLPGPLPSKGSLTLLLTTGTKTTTKVNCGKMSNTNSLKVLTKKMTNRSLFSYTFRWYIEI